MTDKELDEVYQAGDLLLRAGHWSLVDDLLMYYGMSAWRQEIDLLLAWATITLTAQKKLKNRKWFMQEAMKFHSDPKEPNLWKGLYEEDSDPTKDLKMLGFGHWSYTHDNS